MTTARPSWDDYFMQFALLARTRATCIRRQVGAVIVRDRQILTTGYNGAPRGMKHAAEIGCLREQRGIPSGQQVEICRGLHAEQNAIIQAAYQGICIRGAVLYCTSAPCTTCLKMIINAGIQRVYYLEPYSDELNARIAEESGIELIRLPAGEGASS
ncbi:MAG: cytidine/deoxycytidylate deaminase family protein [Deltaproteobacteria bacterium]|nr:cytidine/deoxycytidylate deaminase family protein [Deltaproteobacteria bacterium]